MSDFDKVVQRARDAEVLIGIDRTFARKFYTDVPLAAVEQNTGELPYLEKAVVLGAFVGSPLLLLVSGIAVVAFAGWWSALLIPTGLLLWCWFYSASSMAGASMKPITVVLLLAAIGCLAVDLPTRRFWVSGLIYVGALWIGRFVYSGSTAFLRAFVLRNRRAFEWLRDSLTIRECR